MAMDINKSIGGIIGATVVPVVGFAMFEVSFSALENFTADHPEYEWAETVFAILYILAMVLTPLGILYYTLNQG